MASESRRSDPITEHGKEIGAGTVLYDTRDRQHRTCCAKVGRKRHLHHVTAVYEDVDTGSVLFEVWDGTHTVRERFNADDLLAVFEPAGWTCPVGRKPTYILTREHGVDDPHDLMTRA